MVTNWVEEIVNLFIKINFTIGNSFEVRLRDREREREGGGGTMERMTRGGMTARNTSGSQYVNSGRKEWGSSGSSGVVVVVSVGNRRREVALTDTLATISTQLPLTILMKVCRHFYDFFKSVRVRMEFYFERLLFCSKVYSFPCFQKLYYYYLPVLSSLMLEVFSRSKNVINTLLIFSSLVLPTRLTIRLQGQGDQHHVDVTVVPSRDHQVTG